MCVLAQRGGGGYRGRGLAGGESLIVGGKNITAFCKTLLINAYSTRHERICIEVYMTTTNSP